MDAGAGGLQGPHVKVSREGTADAGGGTLLVVDGEVIVQGAVRGRRLGAVAELHRITFSDQKRQALSLHFFDSVWLVASEQADLLPIAEQIQQQLGRTGLIEFPPSPTEQLKGRGRDLGILLGVLAVGVGLYFGISALPALGYLTFTLAALALAAALVGATPGAPSALAPVGRFVQARGPLVAFSTPGILLAASLAGIWSGHNRADEQAWVAESEARAAAAVAEEQAAEQAAADEVSAALGRVLAQAEAAASGGDFGEVARLLEEADARWEGAPQIAALRDKHAAKLQEAAEASRQEAIKRGLQLSRAVARDRMKCESAKVVADAWAGLRQLTPADPGYEAATRLVPELEACRSRVERAFGKSAIAGQMQARTAVATHLEDSSRSAGHAATVKLEGRAQDVLTAQLDALDGEIAAAIVGADEQGKTVLQRAEAAGFRRVELRGKKGQTRDYDLKPPTQRELGRQVLEGFGLGAPIRLAAPEAAGAAGEAGGAEAEAGAEPSPE